LPSPAAQPQPTTPAGQAAAPDKRPRIRIGNIRLIGINSVYYRDEAVEPDFEQRMTIDSLTLGRLDSATPDQPSTLALKAKLGTYSGLTADGTVSPFAKRPTLDLKGRLNAFELPPLSSYSGPELGYTLNSGTLDSDFKMKMEQGVMDGEAKVSVNNLELKTVNPELMANLQQQLTVPLPTALSLLKDGDNNIRLTLPIKGDINNPEFNFSGIINTAVGNSMKKATFAYLKHALQPYGTLITLLKLGADLSKGLPLDPVVFEAGGTEITGKDPDYLGKIAGMLKERQGLRLRICGKAIESDREVLFQRAYKQARSAAAGIKPTEKPPIADEALLALAKERSETVKAYLVNEQGIAPDRLFICNPEIDKAEQAKPHSDILL
jgi:hypothetical protein